MTISQAQFINDLNSFISSHPYFIQNEGTSTAPGSLDTIVHSISDPDGDYEETQIKITLIA